MSTAFADRALLRSLLLATALAAAGCASQPEDVGEVGVVVDSTTPVEERRSTSGLVGDGSETPPPDTGMAPAEGAETATPVTEDPGVAAADAVAAAAQPAPPAEPETPVPPAAQQGFNTGMQLLERKEWQGAATLFNQLITRFPELPGLYANLGVAQWRGGDAAQGRATLEAAERRFPGFAPIPTQLGLMLREQGQFEAADAAYQRAMVAEPQYPDAIWNRAVLNDLYLQKPKTALSLFEQYQTLRPDDEMAKRAVIELQRRTDAQGAS